MKHEEHEHQKALVDWAKRVKLPPASDVEPGAFIGHYLLAIPNGGKRQRVTRRGRDGKVLSYSPEGARLKAEGLKAGVSDMLLALRRQGYAGLWLEMKAPGQRPTREQSAWLERMRTAGYLARWCDNWTQAAKIIADYCGVRAPLCNLEGAASCAES